MNPFFFYFPVVGQGINLISTAIGQYGSIPAYKPVQSAGLPQYIGARAQVKMIGVAQNDFSFDIIMELTLMNSLDGSCCSDRHKNGSGYDAMSGFNFAGSCFGAVISCG
jgi:hypothetical protein